MKIVLSDIYVTGIEYDYLKEEIEKRESHILNNIGLNENNYENECFMKLDKHFEGMNCVKIPIRIYIIGNNIFINNMIKEVLEILKFDNIKNYEVPQDNDKSNTVISANAYMNDKFEDCMVDLEVNCMYDIIDLLLLNENKQKIQSIKFNTNIYISEDSIFGEIFSNYNNLENIYGLNNLNTSGVTTMNNMFRNCSSLESLDLTSFDTSKVTDMGAMFYGCSSLTSLDLTSFDTSNVTDMGYIFYGCTNLKEIKVSRNKWVIPKRCNTISMFLKCGCSEVTYVD